MQPSIDMQAAAAGSSQSAAMAEMHINYRYVLDFAEKQRNKVPHYKILDYGCGAGDIVVAGRGRGMDFCGAELFYAGGSTRDLVEKKGLLGRVVKEIRDGRLDFPDAFFDLVVNNMVFEHVEDLDQVLAEINRVLKPGGKILSLFPSRETLREGHCGLPFLHWFSRTSRTRYYYALTLRKLGLGYFKGTKTPKQWSGDFLQWIDSYCFYRSRLVIIKAFQRHFDVASIEYDYVSYRLKAFGLGFLVFPVQLPGLKSLANCLFRILGGVVILGQKPAQHTTKR